MNERELLAQKNAKAEEARALNALAESQNRDFTPEEQTKYDELVSGIESIKNRMERSKKLPTVSEAQAPAVLSGPRGDNFPNALRAYMRTGDTGGVRSMLNDEYGGVGVEIRASNNTDMNIGTAADGGDTVPTTWYNEIIARRSEMSLPEKLGARKIPGIGTTVYVPYDNEADGEFISTAEAATFDQDAPALAKATMTLAKYSKYITLSDELLQDTGVNLMGFLTDWIARGQAKTFNSLLLTEVGTNGTAFKTTAASTTLAFGELEATCLNDTVGDYLDDSGSVAWVMRPGTYSTIGQVVSASNRMYGVAFGTITQGQGSVRELLGYPVHFSNKAAAIASTAKVAYFGNWNFVGWREGPGLVLLRDPYSAAAYGQLKLWMYFRTVFTTLQAAAIGYMKMKT